VGIPALARAQQQQQAFVARDLPGSGHWDANGDQASSSVSVATGDTVAFSYPATGASHHTVVFTSAQKPTCTGVPSSNPITTGGPGWSGTCRFDSAGTYTFVCGLHPAMTGQVTVTAAATPTPTTSPAARPTPGAGATPTPTPTPTPPSPATPQSTLRGAVTLAARQHGTRVRGSVQVGAAGSRLDVSLSARLPGARRAVRVGHWHKASAGAGRVAFSVPLSSRARRALRTRHRLSLTVTVTLTPPGSRELRRNVHVTVRRG
jgi:Copper binding proteins, plastocyanin/azurin family